MGDAPPDGSDGSGGAAANPEGTSALAADAADLESPIEQEADLVKDQHRKLMAKMYF